MTGALHTLLRWLRAVLDAYHRAMQLTHAAKPPSPPPAAPAQPVSGTVSPLPHPEDEPPIVRRSWRRSRDAANAPATPAGPPAPETAPAPPATGPGDPALPPEQRLEQTLSRLESAEPALEDLGDVIRERKQLARLAEELQNQKRDARAAERLERIRANLARAALFEERMQDFLQANQVRAAQRKAEIEAELGRNEQKIHDLEQERARLSRAREQQDLARLEEISNQVLRMTLVNDDLISEKALLAEALARPAGAAPADADARARMAAMETSLQKNIRRLAELEAERQDLLRSREPATRERLQEIEEAIQSLSLQERAANRDAEPPGAENAELTPERKQEIDTLLLDNTARLASLEAERARLIEDDAGQSAARLREIDDAIRALRDANDSLLRERDMIIRALTPPARPPLLGREEMVHLSAIDEHKRTAKREAYREAERNDRIIEEQKARARERAERDAAMLRKRTAEIEAEREANILARTRRGSGRPPAPPA